MPPNDVHGSWSATHRLPQVLRRIAAEGIKRDGSVRRSASRKSLRPSPAQAPRPVSSTGVKPGLADAVGRCSRIATPGVPDIARRSGLR